MFELMCRLVAACNLGQGVVEAVLLQAGDLRGIICQVFRGAMTFFVPDAIQDRYWLPIVVANLG